MAITEEQFKECLTEHVVTELDAVDGSGETDDYIRGYRQALQFLAECYDLDVTEECQHENTDYSYCNTCAGSGEGMHDGTRCLTCNGSGTGGMVCDDCDEPIGEEGLNAT